MGAGALGDGVPRRGSAIPAGDKFWANDAANAAQWWTMNARDGTTPDQFLESINTSVPAGAPRDALLKGLASYGASFQAGFFPHTTG